MPSLACLSLILAMSPSLAHPVSVSSSRIHVDRQHVQLELRCQASTLIEAIPADRNADGKIDADELEQARGAIETYVLDRYVLIADGVGVALPTAVEHGSNSSGQGERLIGRLVRLAAVGQGDGKILPAEPLIDMEFAFEAAKAITSVRVEFALFREVNPWHRDQSEILWNGRDPETRLLWIENPSWTFEPGTVESKSVVSQYIMLGVDHILTGYDHIAFLIALIVASRRVRSLLGVVTAFTIAHSVSLACAATGVIEVSPRIVEPLIALSIAFVGFRNVFDRRLRRLWPEAFGFGLVHGLGFAGSIAETLAAEKAKLAALFGFNLGVELGQVAIVIAVTLMLGFLTKFVRVPRFPAAIPFAHAGTPELGSAVALAPNWVLKPTSAIVGMLGIYWVVARVW